MLWLRDWNAKDVLELIDKWRFSLIQGDLCSSVTEPDAVVIHVYREEEFTLGNVVTYLDDLFPAEVHTRDVQEVEHILAIKVLAEQVDESDRVVQIFLLQWAVCALVLVEIQRVVRQVQAPDVLVAVSHFFDDSGKVLWRQRAPGQLEMMDELLVF